jgi:hypothetical protein
MESSYPIINLVGQKRDVSIQKDVHKKRLIHSSMLVTGGYLVLLILVVGIRLMMVNQFNKLENEISNSKANISSMESKETKFRLISSKLTELTKFIDNKKPIQPKINKIYAIMPNGVLIEDISFGESEDILAVRVVAGDVFDVGNLLKVISDAVETDFSQIKVSSTRRTDDGTYNLELEFQFENG